MTGVSGGLVDDGEDRPAEVASLALVCDGRSGIPEFAHERVACLACSAGSDTDQSTCIDRFPRLGFRPATISSNHLDSTKVRCWINPARFVPDGTVLRRRPSSSLSPPSFLSTLARRASSVARSASSSPSVEVRPSDVLTAHSLAPQRLSMPSRHFGAGPTCTGQPPDLPLCVVPSAGFEPATHGLGNRCSIP